MPSPLLPSIVLLAASEHAPRLPLDLEWRAPEGCPAGDDVVGAVTRLVSDARSDPLRASVQIQESADAYSAEVRFGGGHRTLLGASCRELTEAVVVLLALAIDPDARTASTGFGPTSAALPEPRTRVKPPPAREPALERAALAVGALERTDSTVPSTWELSGFAHVVGELGMLPGVSLGASAGVRLTRSPGFVELAALGLLPRTQTMPSNTGQGGDLYFLGGALAACWVPRNPTTLFACLGLEGGRLTGVGFGADTPSTGHALWLAPFTRAALRLPLAEHTEFEASLALAVPLSRPDFGIDGVGLLHTPEAVSGRVSLGVGFF